MAGINSMGSERDVTERIDTDVFTTENLSTDTGKHAHGEVGDAAKKAGDKARGARDTARDEVGDAAKKAGDKAREARDTTQDEAGDAAKRVGDKARGARNTVQDTARDIKGEADRAAGAHEAGVKGAQDEAGQKADRTKHKAGELAGSVQDTAGAAGQAVKEKAGQVKDAVGHAAGETKEKAGQAAQDAQRRGEQTGKATHDGTGSEYSAEVKDSAKGVLGGIQNIMGEASAVIQDSVNERGENITKH